MDLSGRHLILGMTGGIAAYKACELVRRLRDEGASVRVVMTRAAQEFVTPTTMQALSGQPVFTDQWGLEGGRVDNAMPHIDLTRGADAIVVAPASAHFLARTAQGLADDLLSTLVLARTCPLLAAPAMNVEMWSNPATQRNVHLVRSDGVVLLGPGEGAQACGETGSGRMLEAHELLEEIVAFFQSKLLLGRRVLMTAGPTFEPIDPVRGITNLSSGKMGFAIARAARFTTASPIAARADFLARLVRWQARSARPCISIARPRSTTDFRQPKCGSAKRKSDSCSRSRMNTSLNSQ